MLPINDMRLCKSDLDGVGVGVGRCCSARPNSQVEDALIRAVEGSDPACYHDLLTKSSASAVTRRSRAVA